MKHLLMLMSIALMLTACSATTDKPAEVLSDSLSTADSLKTVATKSGDPKTAEPQQTKRLVTFLELGAESCVPCKMMQPILKAINEKYQGVVVAEFHDLYKDKQIGQKYAVRVMPTQIFLDSNGKEFFRHEGFYPQVEIEKLLLVKAKISVPANK